MSAWNAAPAPHQPAGGTSGALKRLPVALISACCGGSLVWHKDWAGHLITSSLGITATVAERGTAWLIAAMLSLLLALLSAWCVQDVGTISASLMSSKSARALLDHHAAICASYVELSTCQCVRTYYLQTAR